MNIKLTNTYHGDNKNMHKNKCFYCYTIYDKKYNMYYSGVKNNIISGNACIGKKYFTSSTVTDFKKRFIDNPNEFDIYVEYFDNTRLAFLAERNYHNIYDVGKSKLFYNVIKSGGSNCGAGSVLCKSSDGVTYRVSCHEYKNKKHKHVSTNLIHVYLKEEPLTLLTINRNEFNPTIHQTQFTNYVLCIDTQTGKNRRIPKHIFENNSRYVGITKGTVTAYIKNTNEKIILTSEEYAKNKKMYYVKCIPKTIKAYDIKFKKFVNISRSEYHNNKKRYKHNNFFHLNVYDIINRCNKTIDRNEYDKNKQQYRNIMDLKGYIFKIDNILFSNKVALGRYLIENYNVKLNPRYVRYKKLNKLFPRLQTINFDDYKNGETFENN